MADSRKLFFALAVVTLVFSVTASAQVVPAFQCVANAAVPPTIRAEGLTELVGDLVLNCGNGTPTAAGVLVPRVNIQIFLNTNITSRWGDPESEALLMIDDPAAGNQKLCASTGGCSQRGVGGAGLPYATGGLDGGTTGEGGNQTTTKNIYQGRQAGANSIVWLGVPIDPPGTTATRIIRLKNIRANANQLGVSTTLVPSQIVEFISITGETSIPVNNPQQIVGFVQVGLTVSLREPCGDGLSSSGWKYLQCVSRNKDTYNDSAEGLDNDMTFQVRFSEGFATAFKRRNAALGSSPWDTSPTPIDQSSPAGVDPANGLLYNTETGFYNSALGAMGDVASPGLADHGTRLRVAFANIPAG
ncbi:MAG: hypothetical protein AAB225_07395, partial [Acidobacteriota bacterium]